MADFKYGKYNGQRLFLEQSQNNTEWNFDSQKSYLEIGIKGTKSDGLVEKRMKVIKQKIAQDLTKNFDPSAANPNPAQKNLSSTEMEIQNIFKNEYEKMIKENTEQRTEYEKKLQSKNAQINQLNTTLANTKTEINIEKEKAESYSD